jgi:predicted dithiol-disulfide oxidoreductase (DUF899 family)
MATRRENIAFIENLLKQENGHIEITETLKWGSSKVDIPSLTSTKINYVYDGHKGKTNLTNLNEELIELIINAINNNKYL